MSMKDAYEKKLRAQLDEWKADMAKLKAKAEIAEANVEIEYHKHIKTVQKAIDAADSKLQELEHAGDEAWENLQTNMDKAWNDVKQAVQAAVAKFK